MKILKEIDFEYIDKNIEIIASAELLVIDCNLEVDIIEYLLKLSQERKIVNLVEAVSVEKILKLKNRLVMIDFLRANIDEAEILLDLREENKKFSFSKRINNIFKKYSEELELPVMIISAGKEGIYLFEKENRRSKLIHFNAEKVKSENIIETTGAGDALTAGFAAGLHMKKDVDEAINLGIKAASLTIQSSLTCNPEIRKIL
jgi:pseudouridine kinase